LKFKDEWSKLKKAEHSGSFRFSGTAADWSSAVSSHFKTSSLKRPYYGVYVIYQKTTGKILYVGKAGTMRQDGFFKGQDLPKRLVNREKGQGRKDVFGQRVADYGELIIEYVILKSKSLIPGYLEALLLQAYYDEHNRLPVDNASF
jgi:hypothetical protein